jgi:hypothetical protein
MNQVRHKYRFYRGDIDPWVHLLVRKGPRAVWREVTKAPDTRPGRLGYSRVAQGHLPGQDVVISLCPQGKVDPHPRSIDPIHVRAFLTELLPGLPLDPRLAARAAMTEEHGPRPSVCFTGYGPLDDLEVTSGDLRFGFLGFGYLFIVSPSVHRGRRMTAPSSMSSMSCGPSTSSWRRPPAGPAIASSAAPAPDGSAITGSSGSRSPLAGDRAVGFPGRVPAATPVGGNWREPSEIHYRCWNLSRSVRRPHEILEFVLGELLALWGYEADPVVIAEILERLEAMRVNQPISERS